MPNEAVVSNRQRQRGSGVRRHAPPEPRRQQCCYGYTENGQPANAVYGVLVNAQSGEGL